MVDDLVDALAVAAAALLEAGFGSLPDAGVVEVLCRVETVRRMLAAVDVAVLAELESRAVAGVFGRTSTADLLVSELRVSPGEARSRVARATELAPRRSLTGEPLPPLMPAAADAVGGGIISVAHVAVIADCLDHLPAGASVETLGVVERTLVAAAGHEHPVALRRTASMLLTRLDPDGAEPRHEELHRHRELTLARNRDGSGRLTGRLTPEATAIWDTILDALSAPTPADPSTGAGERDTRTGGQRRHDALTDAGLRLLRSDTLPACGGIPVTILATTTLAELTTSTGTATTSRGEAWPLAQLLATSAASEAEIIPVINDRTGAVLALGRSRRLATRAQRLALATRDRGCTFPGCDRPPAWTQAHHVIPWQQGGPTDLDNLCLLCRYHHREFQPRGWQVIMRNGLPEWTPPPWLDPTRTPRRNHTHHPPDIHFDLERIRAARRAA